MASEYVTEVKPASPNAKTTIDPDQKYETFLAELPNELREYITDEVFGWDTFDHPFAFLTSFKNLVLAEVFTPEQLIGDLEAMGKSYEELCAKTEFDAALDLIQKRHRRKYLLDLIQEHGVTALLPAIRSVWVDVELITADYWFWDHIWTKVNAVEGNRRKIIRREDIDTFDALPETFTVYRGYRDCPEPFCGNPNCHEHEMEYGWSWTMNREKAEWFARRRARGVPRLATATVSKNKVLAYFNDRNEQEIVLHPDYLSCEIDFTMETLSENEEAA